MSYNTELQQNNTELHSILAAVNALPNAGGGGAEPVIESLEITENGTYTAQDGVDGYSPVSVNVPIPEGYIVPSGELEITENGEYDITDKASVIVAVEESGGGGIEHTYTVDYIPSVNTKAFKISIPGFSFAPSYVDCRAVTEIPNPTGLQGAVRFSVYNNFRVSNNPTAYTQGIVITKKPDGGSDYWNVFSRVTATDKEVIIDATTQNTWEFIAGVTYRFIVVEGSG